MMSGVESWELTVVPDERAMSEAAADIVTEWTRAYPHPVITVPTGSTPLGMYDILAARAARGEVDFGGVEVFCLDEYVGVTPDDPNSLTGWLRQAFLDRSGVAPAHVHALPVTSPDLDAAAAAYERDLAALGGLNLAVLGLGPNGHIAYNEPGSPADSRTRVVDLTPGSIAQASAYWQDTVPIPHRAMTVGVQTLRDAGQIVLIVSGSEKADILRRALTEPPSAEVPASWLRLAGPRLTVIADRAAAGELAPPSAG